MKKILSIGLLVFLMTACTNADAQKIKDWLNTKKQEAKEKANNKINQKTSEGIDKAIDAPETAIKKKKEKKGKKNESADDPAVQATEEESAANTEQNTAVVVPNEAPSETGKLTIQTNIKCDLGKKKIVALLKKQDGVSSVELNTKTGEIVMAYNSDATSYSQFIKLINDNGFEADGNAATAKKVNPCK